MNGAGTNPDAHVVAYAAAQVKKGLEIAHKLQAENFGEAFRWNEQRKNIGLNDFISVCYQYEYCMSRKIVITTI